MVVSMWKQAPGQTEIGSKVKGSQAMYKAIPNKFVSAG